MQVKFTLSIGLAGAQKEETVELEDDLSEDEIEEAWQDWTYNYIDGGWTIL